MIKATRVSNTIICVIENKLYQKNFDSDVEILKVYELLLNTDDTQEEELIVIKNIFAPKATKEEIDTENKIKDLEKEVIEQKLLLEWFNSIREEGNENFEVSGFKFYVKGINITVPEFLINTFYTRKDNEVDTKALINFWRLLALNSDPRCRENLYDFLHKHNITVTPSGYFVAYRNVNIKEENNQSLNDFIVEKWLKVKVWKKSPKNYSVINTEDGYDISLETQITTDLFTKIVGNLEDLYNNLSDTGTVYTDAHTGTFNIKIGEMVTMPKEDCDASQDEQCSRGLHVASSSWLSENYFGSQGIVCLVNPSHVVSVPYADAGKLRCYQYLPIGLAEYDDTGKIIPIDTFTFEYDFSEYTQAEIDFMITECDLESLKEHELIPKELNIESLRNASTGITISREEMNNIILNKVIRVND